MSTGVTEGGRYEAVAVFAKGPCPAGHTEAVQTLP